MYINGKELESGADPSFLKAQVFVPESGKDDPEHSARQVLHAVFTHDSELDDRQYSFLCGVYPIFGEAGSGKSSFLITSADSVCARLGAIFPDDTEVFLIGEPDYSDASLSTTGIMSLLIRVVSTSGHIFLVDSLRDLTIFQIKLNILQNAIMKHSEKARQFFLPASSVRSARIKFLRDHASELKANPEEFKDDPNLQQALQARIAQLRSQYEAANPGSNLDAKGIAPRLIGSVYWDDVPRPVKNATLPLASQGQIKGTIAQSFEAYGVRDHAVAEVVSNLEWPDELKNQNNFLTSDKNDAHVSPRSSGDLKGSDDDDQFASGLSWSDAFARGGVSMSYLGMLGLLDQLAVIHGNLVLPILNPLLVENESLIPSINAMTKGAINLTPAHTVDPSSLLRLADADGRMQRVNLVNVGLVGDNSIKQMEGLISLLRRQDG